MCKCNPSVRTPYCGKLNCEWPESKPEGARTPTPDAAAVPLVPEISAERLRELLTRYDLSDPADYTDALLSIQELLSRRSRPSSAGEAKCGRCGGTRWIEWMPRPKGMKDPSSPDDRARRAPCPDCTPTASQDVQVQVEVRKILLDIEEYSPDDFARSMARQSLALLQRREREAKP